MVGYRFLPVEALVFPFQIAHAKITVIGRPPAQFLKLPPDVIYVVENHERGSQVKIAQALLVRQIHGNRVGDLLFAYLSPYFCKQALRGICQPKCPVNGPPL